jgi:hypothetical protein
LAQHHQVAAAEEPSACEASAAQSSTAAAEAATPAAEAATPAAEAATPAAEAVVPDLVADRLFFLPRSHHQRGIPCFLVSF